jgi:hypothetical protein
MMDAGEVNTKVRYLADQAEIFCFEKEDKG